MRASPASPIRHDSALTHANVLALQRTAGNRATQRYLQRMIVAIYGDKDAQPSKNATRAPASTTCNTRRARRASSMAARAARSAGPAIRSKRPDFHMRPLLASDDESIYVLAHGSRYSPSIADMSPKEMARWLRERFSNQDVWGFGWAGWTKPVEQPFTGKIKLVSCHSAAESSHRVGADTTAIYPFSSSYAQELAKALTPTSAKDPFQPSSVQGINGIGWVDEVSGAITAIDKAKYDAATANMASNSDVGAVTGAGKTVNPFTSMPDATQRGAALHAVFGAPVEARVDKAGGRARARPSGASGRSRWGRAWRSDRLGDEPVRAQLVERGLRLAERGRDPSPPAPRRSS